jgi:hypothetical protein
LKITAGGTAIPGGIHINKIIHQTGDALPTWLLQIPATGNLRVLSTCNGNNLTNITSITDNDGQTWAKIEPAADEPQIWYSANRSANPNLTVTISITGPRPTTTFLFWDISGADASPYDTSAGAPSVDVSNLTTINNMPSITPTTTNGLVIAVMGIGQGPGTGFASGAPAGAVFDLVTYTGETELDLMDNADCQAHLYNSSASAENWNWAITSNPENSAFATAAAFKAATTVTGSAVIDGSGIWESMVDGDVCVSGTWNQIVEFDVCISGVWNKQVP